jgi:phage terminase large subunit GpA-like protein
MSYENILSNLLESSRFHLSNIKPSDWATQHRVMARGTSPFPGKFSYDHTPYLKEIVDCLDPSHPAKVIAGMKGAQIGFSTGVIESGIGWIISQNPGNVLFLTGHADLSEEAMGKIDHVIDSCGLRPLIRPNVLRTRNMRTGDTNKSKEFPGGSLVSGSANNHKLLRQRSVRYGFIDDFEAVRSSSTESGSTTRMIEQRFAAYADNMKLFYISTPELKQDSNIEPVYQMGDQRRYHIPCPCCGTFIVLNWNVPIEGNDKEMAGITWRLDSANKLIPGSVGYICQECGKFFDDKNKYELNLLGEWRPTAEPSAPGYYSYHLSSLYAPPGMYDWEHYVRQYLEANPTNAPQIERLQQTFVNLCLGETYEAAGEAPRANDLQKNLRKYEIGLIPEKISLQDGNGKIVLITCACDMNGLEDDARLDYEILAWSETGSSYSIDHGSIGTFVPREGAKKHKEDRERWTYEHYRPNSVWRVLNEVLEKTYLTDTGRKMKIGITGVDSGHYTQHAYTFIDTTNSNVVGLKGKDADKYIRFDADMASFRYAKERSKLFLVEVNRLKDELAELMKLKWDSGNDDRQPVGFMNYPQSANGKYLFQNFFSHYEAEHRVIESKTGEALSARWIKKSSISQNHFWDVRIYNMVLRDIVVNIVCKELKIKNYGWTDYVDVLLGRKQF